jgi:uncharacterized protein
MAIDVHDDPDNRRYEITVDGAHAGEAVYVRKGSRTIFTHTEIDDAFGGQGLGGKLAKGALDAERSRGTKIVPLCPFIVSYVEKHPEYAPLVDSELLEMLETS